MQVLLLDCKIGQVGWSIYCYNFNALAWSRPVHTIPTILLPIFTYDIAPPFSKPYHHRTTKPRALCDRLRNPLKLTPNQDPILICILFWIFSLNAFDWSELQQTNRIGSEFSVPSRYHALHTYKSNERKLC